MVQAVSQQRDLGKTNSYVYLYAYTDKEVAQNLRQFDIVITLKSGIFDNRISSCITGIHYNIFCAAGHDSPEPSWPTQNPLMPRYGNDKRMKRVRTSVKLEMN